MVYGSVRPKNRKYNRTIEYLVESMCQKTQTKIEIRTRKQEQKQKIENRHGRHHTKIGRKQTKTIAHENGKKSDERKRKVANYLVKNMKIALENRKQS